MTPAVHVLCGAAFGGFLPPRSRSLGAVMVACAAACLPDVDVVAVAAGPEALAAVHRVMTHSFVGVVGTSAALVLVVALFRPEYDVAGVFGFVFAAQATHLALDMCNGYGIQIMWPFFGDWASIADWPSSSPAGYAVFAALLALIYRAEAVRGARLVAERLRPGS